MTRYDYRHGPRQGRHPATTHRRTTEAIPRAKLTLKHGWCQLCAMDGYDVAASAWAMWDEDGDRFKVSVCNKHRYDGRLAR